MATTFGRKFLQVFCSVGPLALLNGENTVVGLHSKVLIGGINILHRRWYRGSKRFIRQREKRAFLEERDRLRKEGVLPSFNFTSFIIENYDKELYAFQKRLDIEFENKRLLYSAFVHPSIFLKAEGQTVSDNLQKVIGSVETKLSWNKLALLGFTLTSQILTESLYNSYPLMTAELIKKYVDSLMSREVIFNLTNNLGITELILTEPHIDKINQEKHLPYTKEDVVCDVFYALVGALYFDNATRYQDVVKTFIDDFILMVHETDDFKTSFKIENPKKQLQDMAALSNLKSIPKARVIFRSGKGSEFPLYVIGVYSSNNILGEGAGQSIDSAVTAAYENGISRMLQRNNISDW